MSRVALVVNPTSGRGRGARAGAAAAAALRSRGHDVDDLSGPTAETAAKFAANAVATGTDVLVVVGGDGAVHLGVNAVAGTGVPLGIVAAGSGNDVARALGLPLHDPGAAVSVVHTGLTGLTGDGRPVDVARWTGGEQTGWYAAVLAAGFDAVVNERANRWSWPRGQLRYSLALARELPVFRPRPYRIVVDDTVLEGEATLVAVANTCCYGGGMRIAPNARVDDGLLDVVVLEAVSVPVLLRLYPSVFAGRHVTHPRVRVLCGRHVEIDAPGIVGYADGERLADLPLACDVVPGGLRVLAPAAVP